MKFNLFGTYKCIFQLGPIDSFFCLLVTQSNYSEILSHFIAFQIRSIDFNFLWNRLLISRLQQRFLAKFNCIFSTILIFVSVHVRHILDNQKSQRHHIATLVDIKLFKDVNLYLIYFII